MYNEDRIFVDTDACPVVRKAEEVAKKYSVPVTLLCDTNHILQSKYSEVRVIGSGAAADGTSSYPKGSSGIRKASSERSAKTLGRR